MLKSIPKHNNGNELNSIEENAEEKLDPTQGYDVDSGDD